MFSSVRIVGAGLIGSSIGLALSAKNITVEMVDIDERSQGLSSDLVGSVSVADPELIIIATPLGAFKEVFTTQIAMNPNSIVMDIGSVKTKPTVEVETLTGGFPNFVATHPMAGREIGGAESARADLFISRRWIITPGAHTNPSAVAKVVDLIEGLGAKVVTLSPEEHDAAVARISHLPQIVSSLLAGTLEESPGEWLELSGAGLRDTTRIAASDHELWKEIIHANRGEISSLLINLQKDIAQLIISLDDEDEIAKFLQKGRVGRSKIPGKHGGKAREYAYLPIVIEDKPGQLGAIFNECAAMSVNVEDLSIEHSPGQLTALITLALTEKDASTFSNHLASIGWNVHPIRK
jgi:prephenate dehydrogenase